ncbi:MAG: alanyl-tRNA editing protein [Armatimonadota bacterium]
MTLKLFHRDAYLREWTSPVTAVRDVEGRGLAIALAETVFYAASGGQPSDRGHLGGLEVRDVREEDGEVWHVLTLPEPAGTGATPEAPKAGAHLAGVLDWERRFDHMQQHTGQHILSGACLRVLHAHTVAVHMAQTCTLDLAISALDAGQILQVEGLANTVIMENRPVTVLEVDDAEAAALGLRRPPKQTGLIRVVEVEGFDRSACGGTHVRASGEVGPIVIRGWERNKGGMRVEFLCGWRAFRDYHRMRDLVRDLAGQLTTGEDEIGAAVARMREQVRSVERDLVDARGRLLDLEADGLIDDARARAAAPAPEAPLVIAAAFAGRAMEELRALARALTARTACVAILVTDLDRRVLVARSNDVSLDASAVLRETVSLFGGRGGGRPEASEGAATAAPSASALVAAARTIALRRLGLPDA